MRTRSLCKLFVILLLHIGSTNTYCGVGIKGKITISGVVTEESESGEPVIGATIAMSAGTSRSGAVTDFDGKFEISLVPQDQQEFEIKVSYVGFKEVRKTFSVSSLINGQGTVAVVLVENIRKNKKKFSTIRGKDLVDDIPLRMLLKDNLSSSSSGSNSKTPQQLSNEADIYFFGYNGTNIDYIKAFKLYLQAAEQGHADSQLQVGYMYATGKGIAPNKERAVSWYRKSADQGNKISQYNLGLYYEEGIGVEKNYATAAYWYQKSAEQNYAKAQSSLAGLYLNGNGVAKDYNQSFYWANKAAEQDDAYGQFILGYLYSNGSDKNRDYNLSMQWYLKAANQDNTTAMNNIGVMYECGQGVSVDKSKALAWYNKAAEKGYEQSKKNAANLVAQGVKPATLTTPQTKNLATTTKTLKTTTKTTVQPTTKTLSSVTSSRQKRLALIIGNGDYTDGPLMNPVNDAKDMRAKLSELGFEVMGTTNMKSKGAMRDMVRDFCSKAKNYDAVLFFYSGHARQDNGVNYLIPTRSDIKSEGDIEDQCMSMNWVVREMQGTGSKNVIVLLDACRNAPPIPQIRRDAGVKGLANMPAKRGTFVGFATQSGEVASDGHGQRNSPYTAALLKMLSEPGLPHYTLFRRVKQMVLDATNQTQMPAEDDKLPDDFVFNQK